MTDDVSERCPECGGSGASCEHCCGTGEITDDDHDAFKFNHGTVVDYRGTKRIVFYEHEGDHVILWWFPGDTATHGPPDATEAEKNVIYGQLWQELEDYWAPSPDDDRDC